MPVETEGDSTAVPVSRTDRDAMLLQEANSVFEIFARVEREEKSVTLGEATQLLQYHQRMIREHDRRLCNIDSQPVAPDVRSGYDPGCHYLPSRKCSDA